MQDCVRVLGLRPGCSWADAQKAYQELSLVWHPDRFSEDQRLRSKAELKTEELNKAYLYLETQVMALNCTTAALPKSFFESKSPPKSAARPVEIKVRRKPHRTARNAPAYKAESFGADPKNVSAKRFSSSPPSAHIVLVVAFSASFVVVLCLLANEVTQMLAKDSATPVVSLSLSEASAFEELGKFSIVSQEPSKGNTTHFTSTSRSLDDVFAKRSHANPELILAAESCDLRQVRRLLNGGAKINALDNHGESALIRATKRNCLSVAKLLLASGADIELRGSNGFNARRWAESYNYSAMKDLLVSSGKSS